MWYINKQTNIELRINNLRYSGNKNFSRAQRKRSALSWHPESQHKILWNIQKRTSNEKDQKRQLPFEYVFVQRRIVETNVYKCQGTSNPRAVSWNCSDVRSEHTASVHYTGLNTNQAAKHSWALFSVHVICWLSATSKWPKINMKDRTAQSTIASSKSKYIKTLMHPTRFFRQSAVAMPGRFPAPKLGQTGGVCSKSAGETKRSTCLSCQCYTRQFPPAEKPCFCVDKAAVLMIGSLTWFSYLLLTLTWDWSRALRVPTIKHKNKVCEPNDSKSLAWNCQKRAGSKLKHIWVNFSCYWPSPLRLPQWSRQGQLHLEPDSEGIVTFAHNPE